MVIYINYIYLYSDNTNSIADMKQKLKTRVEKAKASLKKKQIPKAKVKFFDEMYGAVLHSESIRLNNLWAGYVQDEEFTTKLESFVKKQ